jgi:DNA-binding transcriptional regulator YdaS (Cro superfamily)
MAIHAEATEFRAACGVLGIAQHHAAELFGVSPRSVRRWQAGDRRVPYGVAILFRLLAAGVVTLAQIEQAAVPIPARTNGSGEPKPPAPLLVEPAPKQSALARAQAATPAGPGLTTAEKVYALTPEACRWPCGDPGHPDFRFCGRPVAKRPYCEQHRAMAYVASLKSRSPKPANSALQTPSHRMSSVYQRAASSVILPLRLSATVRGACRPHSLPRS